MKDLEVNADAEALDLRLDQRKCSQQRIADRAAIKLRDAAPAE